MSRILSCRVEEGIPPRNADVSGLLSTLNSREREFVSGLPLRSLAAAAAAKQALVELGALVKRHRYSPRAFELARDTSGAWAVTRWPWELPRPFVSVSHSRNTAAALAACEEPR